MTAFTRALRRKPVRRAAAVGVVAAGALFLPPVATTATT